MPLPTVKIDTILSAPGTAPALGEIPISTGAIRASIAATPANNAVSGRMSPEIPGCRRFSSGEEAPSARRHVSAGEDDVSHAVGNSPAFTTRDEPATGTAAGAKDTIAPQIIYQDPGAFHFTAEAGYASKHLWRGIDLAQFASDNSALSKAPKANSDVLFIGANTTYKGFLFGIKYIQTIDDNFNPFFAPLSTELDVYSELVLSANYTRMLVGTDLLQGTLGFDFYYYPNGEFWGVDNQGMLYARFSSPHCKWAQPFLDVFYNIAIDSDGNGLATTTPNIRGAGGSDLVEGGGCEIGVSGGDRIFTNDLVTLALTYSLSTFYKSGYQFEPDGFSHIGLTIGAPLTIGSNFAITPSVSYIESLQNIPDNQHGTVNFGGSNAEAWNSPGWVGTVKSSWSF